jgi:hypothetical protein
VPVGLDASSNAPADFSSEAILPMAMKSPHIKGYAREMLKNIPKEISLENNLIARDAGNKARTSSDGCSATLLASTSSSRHKPALISWGAS